MKIDQSCFTCLNCINVFHDNEKIDGLFFENSATRRPCMSTFIICKHIHFFFDTPKDDPNFDYKTILSLTKNTPSNEILFENTDFTHSSAHKNNFIDTIIDEYVRMYGTYIARCMTLEQYQLMLRARNKRAVIFGGQ